MPEAVANSSAAPTPQPQSGFHAFWADLVRQPYRYDLFHAMRTVQAHHAHLPLLGTAQRPRGEPIRMGQDPSLSFAPATIAKVLPATDTQPQRLTVWSFGLYGPNGPLPTHLTEYVRDRLYHHNDQTLARFSDVFHHRLLLLFFRAWSDAQPTVSLDRPGNNAFGRYVGSLIGQGEATTQQRDAVPDHAKWYLAGHLSRQSRNPEGLQRALQLFFDCQVRVEEFCLTYLSLEKDQQTRLGRGSHNSQLGVDTVVGDRVPDAQSKFRLHLGPLPLAQYEKFLPGQPAFQGLVDWVHNYIGIEFDWDLRLILRKEDIPPAGLGAQGRLGWTSWVQHGPAQTDAGQLCLNPERWLKHRAQAKGAKPRAASATASQQKN
jgi:type VI secretion system protein ImpH